MTALLHDQNQLALRIGPRGRFLQFRCAALTSIGRSHVQPSPASILPSRSTSRGEQSRGGNNAPPTPRQARQKQSVDARLGSEKQSIPLDIEAVPLKPPGHAQPDFAVATIDATSGGGITAVASGGERCECDICGRLFAADRITAHEKACSKANRIDRRAFNMQEHRVRQTYAENNANDDAERVLRTAADEQHEAKALALKSKRASWRQQSAALQNAMRNARGQSDQQPFMMEDVDHRVECAGCGRRFAPDTAETHIPKCIEKARRNGRR
jgi:hypothetical protein